MTYIDALSRRIPVRSPTLIGVDFSLTTLIGITSKRKQFLTCTQKTTRVKIELNDYAQQDLSKVIKRSPLDMQRF
jgi:Holliday junction resolvasome RuvABC ATP-dependent DNA helicase subunit